MDASLQTMLTKKKIPHALLFTGENAEEKAYEWAHAVICLGGEHHRKKLLSKNHPDLHIYKPEGKIGLHPIRSLNHLKFEAHMKAFEGSWKIFLIHDAEKMLPASGNALLKTLEEPSSFTVIILLSSHPEKILPTIRSRCQTFEFTSSTLFIFSDLLDFLAKKIPKEEFVSKYQEEIYSNAGLQREFFKTILLWYRDRYLLDLESGKNFLSFPDRSDQIKQIPLIPLEKVEKRLQDLRFAFERSVKFSHCLDILEAPFTKTFELSL